MIYAVSLLTNQRKVTLPAFVLEYNNIDDCVYVYVNNIDYSLYVTFLNTNYNLQSIQNVINNKRLRLTFNNRNDNL